MKTKILLLIANLMIFAMPLLANTTESDTIWTRNLLPGDIRGCAFTLTGDSIVAISGESGGDSLYILETATGNILKRVGIRGWTFSYSGFIHFNTKSWVAINVPVEFGGLYIYDYINDKVINDKFSLLGKGVVITNDDKFLIVPNSQSDYNNISIINTENWEFIDSISTGYGLVSVMDLSPDDEYLAIASGHFRTVNPDPENPEYEEKRLYNKITVLKYGSWELVKEFDQPYGSEGKVNDIIFSPDGNYLGVAKLDGSVRVYDIINLELYRKFIVYGYSDYSGPRKISFTRDSKNILCGIFGYDFFTRIFDIENNELVKTLSVYSFTGLDASTKDSILVSSSGQITLLMPNILTDVKEKSEIIQDTININIMKSKSSTFQFKYNEIIKKQELYDYNGNILNKKNILNINNETLLINAEYLPTGVYFLVINDNNKPIKILVTE